MKIRGFLEEIVEANPGGVIWSIRDPSLPGEEGLYALESGDELRVLDGTGGTLWEGMVSFDRLASRSGSCPDGDLLAEDPRGMWHHGTQLDVDRGFWRRLFAEHRRAVLRRGPPNPWDRAPHPFSGPADGLAARLAALSPAQAEALLRSALGAWLGSGDSTAWRGPAHAWGLGPAEALGLLGPSSAEGAEEAASDPCRGERTPLPFSLPLLERLGRLFGLNAALLWGLPDASSRAAWLASANARLGDLPPLQLLLGGEMEGLVRVLEAARADLV
ncbi:hypothetical protein EAH89_30460 [Roseomonas nepalensis]|uniref:DUF2384 domain-containing protein n=1 Tax=Muricoccus nepalensis TaxID=1854500 RepID=A0A502EGG7_9PROT|nr:hypothetical protein [Roseomonas nepalensis]TPG35576.1 hypothetical protein EAH89_30460 [Roseomonas nepalensis]